MRRSVTLQLQATGVDSFGEPNGAFTNVATLGADIRTFSLSEVTALNRESTVTILQFDFNYGPTSAAISTPHRLVFNGDVYDVISVNTANAFDQANGKTVRVLGERRT